jgi:hypothetical protein
MPEGLLKHEGERRGTMLVFTSITMGAGANVEGHALARGGAVTLSTNLFTQPTCT